MRKPALCLLVSAATISTSGWAATPRVEAPSVSAPSASSPAAAQGAGVSHPGGTLVLYPAGHVREKNFASGCWVHLYDGIDYKGEQLTLVGPIELPTMNRTQAPWRDWDSVEVGPQAKLTIYRASDFRLPAATLLQGERVRDLTATTGRFEDINSVRVACGRRG